MKKYALIVAGGSGTRMDSSVPKQFMILAGRPVLMHTIEAFAGDQENPLIIVVLPADHIDHWKNLCQQYGFNIPHQHVAGGATRFQSVKNGLEIIRESDAVVAIHDGARPLVDKKTIEQSFRLAAQHGSAIAAVPLKESLRKVEHSISSAVDRSNFRIIQTPQTFEIKQIKRAYAVGDSAEFTDDATVAEKAGLMIRLFEGSYENLKITTPADLKIAETLLLDRTKKSG
jgi:2-C-methyl-D-erythritol 4-phosphate cytidylyltransferase